MDIEPWGRKGTSKCFWLHPSFLEADLPYRLQHPGDHPAQVRVVAQLELGCGTGRTGNFSSLYLFFLFPTLSSPSIVRFSFLSFIFQLLPRTRIPLKNARSLGFRHHAVSPAQLRLSKLQDQGVPPTPPAIVGPLPDHSSLPFLSGAEEE